MSKTVSIELNFNCSLETRKYDTDFLSRPLMKQRNGNWESSQKSRLIIAHCKLIKNNLQTANIYHTLLLE